MRASGHTTVRTATSARAILLSAALAGTALVGTAAYARAAESPAPGSADSSVRHAAAATAATGARAATEHPALTQINRPRFHEPLGGR